MSQKIIDQFINDLFTQAGLEGVKKEFLNNYRKKVQEEMEIRVFKALLTSLPDNKLDQFKELTVQAGDSPEKIEQFLKDNINNYEKIIEEELNKFKKIFLSKIEKIKQKND